MSVEALIADVAVDCPGRDAYSYLVPPELDAVAAGDCVLVPFGRRRERGFVLDVARRPPPEGIALKALLERREGLRLPPHLLRLIRWAAGYYRCTVGEFLSAAVPAPVREGVEIRRERFLRRAPSTPEGLTRRQREVLALLPHEAVAFSEAQRIASCSAGVLERLVLCGALLLDERREIKELQLRSRDERHALTDEQQQALDRIGAALADGRNETFLLYGVTGSGKTLVYQELAERVVAGGRQVLVLLPEIALTPQLAARFRQRFPRVAVWHSGFTAGERAEQWRRVADGDVDLVIGARSALFAPLPAPGLIIVDEEHDQSYKQDTAPRYQARDLAVAFGTQLGIPVVLGSATPSLESYHNALQERYTVLTLRRRPAGGSLPSATLVDMAAEARRGNAGVPLSGALLAALQEIRGAGDQAIVLLNRRGWSPVVSCLTCGHSLRCRLCDIGLTYHRAADEVRCHYCGSAERLPPRCSACGQPDLSTKGVGTEQLAAVIAAQVPQLRVLRVDADTVATRQGHARLLQAFADGDADCLVGTQMVAKGLDFPRVTLVGIVAADQGLSLPDFRAAERTYQLIAQVAGRAGRGERPGRVIVQAYDTDALPIRCALEGRAKTFYQHELGLRRDYGYPPLGGLLRVLWRGPDEAAVRGVAEEQGALLRSAAEGLPVLGPTQAGIAFLKGQHRWHALVKAPSRGGAQRFLDRLLAGGRVRERRGVSVSIDVDPYSIA